MATNAERAQASRLRRKSDRTPEETAWLDAYEARRQRPGRKGRAGGEAPADAEPAPAATSSSSPPPETPPDAPRAAGGGAPPIEVIDMTGAGGAAGEGANGHANGHGAAPTPEAPPAGVLPEPSPVAKVMGFAVVAIIRSQDRLVGEAFGVCVDAVPEMDLGPELGKFKLGDVVWPGLAATWAFCFDKWGVSAMLGHDLTEETAAQVIAIASGLYAAGGGYLARKKLAELESARKRDAAAAAREAAAAKAATSSSSPSSPAPAPAAPRPSLALVLRGEAGGAGGTAADDGPRFSPRGGGAVEEK